jgi:very-short-patch-repair endonuclease
MTEAEVMLWSRLRLKEMHGVHFRRQHPIGPYIADFACVPAMLVVEVDGRTHATDEQHAHDVRRDAYMTGRAGA